MHRRIAALAVSVITCLALVPVTSAAGVTSPAGQLVRENAASGTPHVLNGSVYAVSRVGDTILLGGAFTQARNDADPTVLTRSNLLAFNAITGVISTTFVPNPNGEVRAIVPTGDGETAYVGGNFTSISGVTRSRLARIRVSDGSVVTGFNAGTISGQIKDLALSDGRLWLAGAFTHVGGKAQPALATVDPATGGANPYMALRFSGVNNGGSTQVIKITISPDGDRLVAVGNFSMLGTAAERQLAMLDLSGPSAAPSAFHTGFFTNTCSSSFDTYLRDVDFSPDGTFFVAVTTGAYGGANSPCDSQSRFEAAATGPNVAPSWVTRTGGDTTYSVEVTPSAVYVGGHFRWSNNPFAGDRPGQGAVSRPGLAALDPLNGLPLTWNPTRTLGVGVFDFLYGPDGLWVASDTDRIGASQYKGRIALLKANGETFPAVRTPGLPNDLFQLLPAPLLLGSQPPPTRRSFTGTAAASATTVPVGSINWSTVRGSFMLNGFLYLALSNGTFTKQTFDGTTYGPSIAVNTSDQLTALTDWRSDIQSMTGLFYDSGRLYFTRSGSNDLSYRYFTPQSGVVGAQRFVAAPSSTGISFSSVRGMFGTGDALYWGATDGRLHRANWANGAQAGAPVAGTATLLSGTGITGVNWSSRTLWLYQDSFGEGVGLPPTAAFTNQCTSLVCDFDSSGSTAPGGQITARSWDFGDGTTGTGVSPQHTYAATGSYPVTLTVTTATGLTDSESRTVDVVRVNKLPEASFTISCATLTCGVDASASSDPDGTITDYSWDFGDGSTGTGATQQHTYAAGGARTVTLTVTDNDGATASTTHDVTPFEDQVAFIAAASSNANTATPKVRIPASVQAGDALVLYLTLNSNTAPLTPPAGWTALDVIDGNGIQGRSWWRAATGADAGSDVTVGLPALAKGDLSVLAYRGSGGTATATAHAGQVDQVLAADHTTPAVTVTDPTSWVTHYWAAKASTDVTWAPPSGLPVRTSSSGSGSGRIVAVVVDSGSAQSPGGITSSTSTATPAVSRTIMFSTVIELE